MSDLAGLLGDGEPGCPVCGADSCSGMPHIQPISINEFYGEPMAQEPLDKPEPETAEASAKRRKRDENRMKRDEDR